MMVPRNTFLEALGAAARDLGRPLSETEAAALATHYRLLCHWNRRMNLTGLKDEAAILRRHFLEPIAAADLLGEEGTLLDVGSGNGFPALPLKVLHPGLDLVLIESSERKSAFLRTVVRETGLKGIRVETRRVRGLHDMVDLLPCRYLTLRAVSGEGLFRGKGGPILDPEGLALFFVAQEQARAIREEGIPGLRFIASRSLPSGPRSVLVILGPEPESPSGEDGRRDRRSS